MNQSRVDRIMAQLEQSGVSQMLIVDPMSIYYLTDVWNAPFERFYALLLRKEGGHIFFLVVTWIIESITKKKIDPKYEAYIHGAGLVLLMGLMLLVTFNDIVRLITGG